MHRKKEKKERISKKSENTRGGRICRNAYTTLHVAFCINSIDEKINR